MRELFRIDKKNYIENGTVGTRPSVRGIIIKDGKIAMMHSKKYDYYKLPGGGIEHVIGVNENSDHKEKQGIQTFAGMIERENRVLRLLKSEEV